MDSGPCAGQFTHDRESASHQSRDTDACGIEYRNIPGLVYAYTRAKNTRDRRYTAREITGGDAVSQ